ncbi:MAG: carboxyl-terminal processing protease [Bacteroidales bacterium]|nr:carboxyl-terminal processing protease [Bacteroidales bacterium]MDN5329630.1 carboxyl-terminal processing protease [Bacteroidales bacterium]
MKTRLRTFVLVLFVLLLSFNGCKAQVDDQKRNLILMDLLKRSLDEGHFNPIPLDDNYSRRVYKVFLEQTDPFKRFYTQEDLALLQPYETQIDDEFKNYSTEFFDLAYQLFGKRFNQIDKWYQEILSKPFDFNRDENFEMDPEKRDWPANEKELRFAWEQMLKYETLTRLADMLEQQEKAKANPDSARKIKTTNELEQEAREKVKKRYADWFHEMKKLDKSDRFGDYLNALCSVFDPHTNYFPPKDKADFDIQFSGQLEGIGATLQSKDGYVTIVNIVPGGPAWKQGELEVKDKIIKVAQGDGEPVDITDWRVDKAVQLIRGKKGTTVKLTVRKLNGTEKTITIVRDVVVIEETYAKSAVLVDTLTGARVGYIFLPSFYANFDDPNGRSSSQDMLREVNKLKNEGVEGIILDLRGNGGGSLQDAIEIAGLFIDQGPVVQVKGRIGAARVYGDPQPGVVYAGPLVVMVNSISASASEILAAALQDHRRALIVGSSNTFGKGTVQRFFNLDDLARGFDEVKPLGSLKMTIQKFYRINGGSTQLRGVSPDIRMSDPYSYIEIGESELKFPMEWTSIDPARYIPLDNDKLFGKLKENSIKRMQADPLFARLDENARLVKKRRDETLIPMKLDNFLSRKRMYDAEAKTFDSLAKAPLSIKPMALKEDINRLAADTTKTNILTRWIKGLRSDAYILESMHIIDDWNRMTATRKE